MSHGFTTEWHCRHLVFQPEHGALWHHLGDEASPEDTLEDWMRRTASGPGALVTEPLVVYSPGLGINFRVPGLLRRHADPGGPVMGFGMKSKAGLTHPHQMWETVELLRSLHGDCEVSVAGWLDDGRFFITLKMGEMKIKGDSSPTTRFVVLVDGYDGRTVRKYILTCVRAVCANTITLCLATADDVFRMKHVKGVEDKRRAAEDALCAYKAQWAIEDELMNKLVSCPFSKTDMKVLASRLYQPSIAAGQEEPSQRAITRAENESEALVSFFEEGQGQDVLENTAYKAIQALSGVQVRRDLRKRKGTTGDDGLDALRRYQRDTFGSGASRVAEQTNVLLEYVGLTPNTEAASRLI
jgi:hypothetical protein